jgi:hypothetical protein
MMAIILNDGDIDSLLSRIAPENHWPPADLENMPEWQSLPKSTRDKFMRVIHAKYARLITTWLESVGHDELRNKEGDK